MKKVLVTGSDGFIGSHLVESLVKTGVEVKALCQYNSFNSWGWLDNSSVKNDIEVVSGDIRDPFFCESISKDVDTIFHLAALIAIPYSYVAPQSYVETNITGTLNICQAALKNKCKVVHTSTSEVYGTAQIIPIPETHPLQPQSPYSASKIAADAMAMSFYNSSELPLTIVRPFNTYGPRQSARAVIPTIISQLASGKKEIQLGDLRPTRDFNYVLDTCQGFIQLAKCEKALGKTVNIGSNTEVTIEEIFNIINEQMGTRAVIVKDEQRMRPEKSEVFRLFCDNSLIKELTNYTPQFNLKKGLAETAKWFTNPENLKMYKVDIYNV